MKKHCLGLVLALLTMTFAPQSQAIVTWDWAFGSEAGTLTTDGTPADVAGPFTFTIDAGSFSVTSSSLTGNIGQSFIGNQQTQGFIWNGSEPTQFFRSSGTYTNGSNFFGPPPSNQFVYGLQPSSGDSFLRFGEGETQSSAPLTLTAVLPMPEPMPVPISKAWLLSLALAMMVLGAWFVRDRVVSTVKR